MTYGCVIPVVTYIRDCMESTDASLIRYFVVEVRYFCLKNLRSKYMNFTFFFHLIYSKVSFHSCLDETMKTF